MHSTRMSSDSQKCIHAVEKRWKVNKEWEGKVGKEDRLFKKKLYEERNPCFFSDNKLENSTLLCFPVASTINVAQGAEQ